MMMVALISMLQSYDDGPAKHNTQAAGAPGSSSNKCTSCHTGGSFGTVSIDFEFKDENDSVVTEYIPEKVYDVKVTVSASSGTPAAYGYQMVALDDENDDNAGDWSNQSSNSNVRTVSSRDYVEHKAPSATNEFTVSWTAPSSGLGDVTFYIGANAVDDNGQRTGDNAKLDKFTISELKSDTSDTIPEGVYQIQSSETIVSYPNPVRDQLHLNVSSNAIVVFNLNGDIVLRGSNQNVMDVSGLPSGLYIIRCENAIGQFLKL